MSQDRKKKGGFGRTLVMLMGLSGAAVAVAWFVAPDLVRSQLDSLSGLFGG